MKITETIERECCQFQDLKPYKGLGETYTSSKVVKLMFCKHCGQIRNFAKEAREPGFSDIPDDLYFPVKKV